jgi:hypothetical protein
VEVAISWSGARTDSFTGASVQWTEEIMQKIDGLKPDRGYYEHVWPLQTFVP